MTAQQLNCDKNSKVDSSVVLDTAVFTSNINANINVVFRNAKYAIKDKIYLSSQYIYYRLNKSNKKTRLKFGVKEPIPTTLYINNDAENAFQFYLEEGKYELHIDAKDKTAKVVGSPLNDEYKEMTRVRDSMFKQYKIMHAILYPYNCMDRDSAHAWLKKYLPLCDSLSDIHINQFYQTHLSSFLTLEHVFVILQYTFEDPGFDTIEYDVKKLKVLFDKLDPKLKRYKMYDECIEMFSRERVKLTEPPKPLFIYDDKMTNPH